MDLRWPHLLALLFALAVSARHWDGPPPTLTPIVNPTGWTPKPTERPLIRRIGNVEVEYSLEYNVFGLVKRQLFLSTCGFINGNASEALTCPQDFICATNSHDNAAGCCRTSSLDECALFTQCIPYTALSTLCGPECYKNPFVARCTDSDFPYCLTRVYNFGTATPTELGCTDVPGEFDRVYLSYSGLTPGSYTAPATNSIDPYGAYRTPVPTIPSSSTFSIPTTFSSSNQQAGVVTVTKTVGPSKSSGGSGGGGGGGGGGSNTGAIVGGVVGGVGGAVLIGGAIFFFLWHKKKKERAAASGAATGGPGEQGYGQQNYYYGQGQGQGQGQPQMGQYQQQQPQQQQQYPQQQYSPQGHYDQPSTYPPVSSYPQSPNTQISQAAAAGTAPNTQSYYSGDTKEAVPPVYAHYGTTSPSDGMSPGATVASPSTTAAPQEEVHEADSFPVMTGMDGMPIHEMGLDERQQTAAEKPADSS